MAAQKTMRTQKPIAHAAKPVNCHSARNTPLRAFAAGKYAKNFFTRKRIVYTSVLSALLIAMILLLVFPIGVYRNTCSTIVKGRLSSFMVPEKQVVKDYMNSPFTIPIYNGVAFVLPQLLVFLTLLQVFVAFLILFTEDIFVQYPIKIRIKRRPTKRQIMQAQIDALQAQVDELKKDRADK